MGTFYEELATVPQPADALHAAKLQWLLRQHEQNYKKLPYFWAGMVYVGDNQPITITAGNKESLFPAVALGILGLFILVSFIYYIFKKKQEVYL
jgi:hypothetical protein